jgi:hypothetical protein
MGPNEKQKIEIEKLRGDPLPLLNQAVKADYSDFLGTALGLTATFTTWCYSESDLKRAGELPCSHSTGA